MPPVVRQPDYRTKLARKGQIGLVCQVKLWIDRGDGRPPVDITFRVDSGATHLTIPAWAFAKHRLPVPPAGTERDVDETTAAGTAAARVRAFRLRAWWNPQLAGTPFDWPALYWPGRPETVPPILGLGGVVTTCRWVIDGRPTPGFPFGSITLEDTR
ncbi:MAG: hypothetical protein K2X87_19545 [Gemmataceae bacterium]|nr:hypothetical protein [Gemmataceae bacterium]